MGLAAGPGPRTLRLVGLLAAILCVPGVAAVGYSLSSSDHPDSLFIYDDMFVLNDRLSFEGEILAIRFTFSADEDVQMRLSAFQNITHRGSATENGNLPTGSDTLSVPNVAYQWLPLGDSWRVTDQETGVQTRLVFADDPDNEDRGYTAAAHSTQVMDLRAGITYAIDGHLQIPSNIYGETPDLAQTVWDIDGDGTFNEWLAWMSVTSWPTKDIDPDQTGSFLDTAVTDTIIRLRIEGSLAASFGTGTPPSEDSEAEPSQRETDLRHRETPIDLWPGKKTRTVDVPGSIKFDLSAPVLADFSITGDLANVPVQVFIDGEPALDQHGNPLVWTPGSQGMKVRLPAGAHEMTFRVITEHSTSITGDIQVGRANLFQETFTVQVEVEPLNLGWYVVGGLLMVPTAIVVATRMRYRYAYVPAWNAHVCTRGRKAVAVEADGRVVRFKDVEQMKEAQDAAAFEERYGPDAVKQWTKQRPKGLKVRPTPGFAGKKPRTDIRAETSWFTCKKCPARAACWDPKKRGAA